MEDALRDGLAALVAFLPKLLLFLIILIVGLLVAKAISKGLRKLLEKVGFDRVVERGGIKKTLSKSSLDAADIIAEIVYWALVLFVLQFAFGVFAPNPVSDLLEGVIAFLPKIIVAIIIIIVVAAIAAAVKTLISNTLGSLSYGRLLANIASFFILGIGVIAALNQVEIATTVTTPILIAVLTTIAGILIVGVGGGLIVPMRQRWEGYLSRAEAEAPRIMAEAEAAPAVGQQLKDNAADVRPSAEKNGRSGSSRERPGQNPRP